MDITAIIAGMSGISGSAVAIMVTVVLYKKQGARINEKDLNLENEIYAYICRINEIYRDVYHIVSYAGRDDFEELFAINDNLGDYFYRSNDRMTELASFCKGKLTSALFYDPKYNGAKTDLESAMGHLGWLHRHFKPSDDPDFDESDYGDPGDAARNAPWLVLLDEFERRRHKLQGIIQAKIKQGS